MELKDLMELGMLYEMMKEEERERLEAEYPDIDFDDVDFDNIDFDTFDPEVDLDINCDEDSIDAEPVAEGAFVSEIADGEKPAEAAEEDGVFTGETRNPYDDYGCERGCISTLIIIICIIVFVVGLITGVV